MKARELAEQYLPCTVKNCYKGCKAKGELFIDEFIAELETLIMSGLPEEKKILDSNASILNANDYARHKERVIGSNTMLAQVKIVVGGIFK